MPAASALLFLSLSLVRAAAPLNLAIPNVAAAADEEARRGA